MTEQVTMNSYANILKEQDNYVITVEGVDWYDYSGFMIPAYLPHCCPEISYEMAQEVVRISGRTFARWDTKFGQVEVEDSQWWYILKRGQWQIEQIKDSKKRWMIRQGKKNFYVRPLSFGEVLTDCPEVAKLATSRYKGKTEIETYEILKKRIAAANKIPGVLEYIGCFQENDLVSFSECYIQNNAVFLANIRHAPAFLRKYSSYALVDGILDYYLNQKKMDYVLDGCRSIYHRTQFQEHLMKIFGFTKEHALLNVVYSARFGIAAKAAYPFRNIIWALRDKWTNDTLDKVGSVLRQEYIRRACEAV